MHSALDSNIEMGTKHPKLDIRNHKPRHVREFSRGPRPRVNPGSATVVNATNQLVCKYSPCTSVSLVCQSRIYPSFIRGSLSSLKGRQQVYQLQLAMVSLPTCLRLAPKSAQPGDHLCDQLASRGDTQTSIRTQTRLFNRIPRCHEYHGFRQIAIVPIQQKLLTRCQCQ